MTKSTQYLYGIDPLELENKFYKEALQYKLDSAKKLHVELYGKDRTYGSDIHKRLFYVQKAIKHTEMLLYELSHANQENVSTKKLRLSSLERYELYLFEIGAI